MYNNTFNEFSTNESPTLSPTKKQKEFLLKEKKNIEQNFSSFFSAFNKDSTKKLIFPKENINYSKIEKEKEENNSKNKVPKRRIIKKIIKKKLSCKYLLDFDYILKEIVGNTNLKNKISEMESSPLQELLKRKRLKQFNKKENGKK